MHYINFTAFTCLAGASISAFLAPTHVVIGSTLTNLEHESNRGAFVTLAWRVHIVAIHLQQEEHVFAVVKSLNGHFPAIVLVIVVGIERGEERELGPADGVPIVGAAVESHDPGPELGPQPDLPRVGLALPLARLLVRADSRDDEREGEEEEGRQETRHCGEDDDGGTREVAGDDRELELIEEKSKL